MEIIWISEENAKSFKFTEGGWVFPRRAMRYLRNAPAELKAIISNANSNTKESLKMKTKIRMKRIKDQRIGGFWERGDIKTYELAVDLINYHMKIMSEEKKETLE